MRASVQLSGGRLMAQRPPATVLHRCVSSLPSRRPSGAAAARDGVRGENELEGGGNKTSVDGTRGIEAAPAAASRRYVRGADPTALCPVCGGSASGEHARPAWHAHGCRSSHAVVDVV